MENNDVPAADPSEDELVAARLAAIVDSSFDAIVSKDLNSIVTTWNRAAEEVFGYSAGEAVGRSILFLIPEDRRTEEDDIIQRIRDGERVATYETLRRHKDGRLIPVSLTVSPIRDRSGRIVGASKIARDISAAKENERRIALLLREVHHRVKNNLQTVSSLIQLQPMPNEIKQELRGRVMTIAAVHEHLHLIEGDGSVDLAHYLRDLFESANESFGGAVTLDLDLNSVQVTADVATTIGLIANELITNTNKYAFPGVVPGTFRARLSCPQPGRGLIHLGNDGIPFDAEERATGIGIRLIRSLAESLSLQYEFNGTSGLHFLLSFPAAAPEAP